MTETIQTSCGELSREEYRDFYTDPQSLTGPVFDDPVAALREAIDARDYEKAEQALIQGADPFSKYYETPDHSYDDAETIRTSTGWISRQERDEFYGSGMERDYEAETCLGAAIRSGDPEIVNLLAMCSPNELGRMCSYKYDAGKGTDESLSPLELAIKVGNPDVCMSLVANGVSIENIDGDGLSALHLVALLEDTPPEKRGELIEVFMNAGVDPEARAEAYGNVTFGEMLENRHLARAQGEARELGQAAAPAPEAPSRGRRL